MSKIRKSAAGKSSAPYWLAAAVVFHVAVWAAWLTFAGFHAVEKVPLAK